MRWTIPYALMQHEHYAVNKMYLSYMQNNEYLEILLLAYESCNNRCI